MYFDIVFIDKQSMCGNESEVRHFFFKQIVKRLMAAHGFVYNEHIFWRDTRLLWYDLLQFCLYSENVSEESRNIGNS